MAAAPRHALPKQEDFYVTAPLLWPLVLALRALNVDADAVLARSNVTLAALQDPDTRVPAVDALGMMQAAIDISGDENLGLKLSQMYEPGMFAVLDYLAHSSTTLREAIERLCRYERIHQNGVRTTLRVEDNRAVLQQDLLVPFPVTRHVIENGLANALVIGRKLTGLQLVPLDVCFTHEAPPDTTEHVRLFGRMPRFGAETNALIFEARWLDQRLVKANPALAETLERHARDLLDKLSRSQSTADLVRDALTVLMRDGDTSVHHVAKHLGLTGRTLQRRLADEGTSFKDVIEELRVALSLRYLDEPSLGIEDVALMLGFSDSRAFRRAFRRWQKVSPSDYRTRAPG